MLIVNNISFSYNDTPVIQNISFTIQKGQNIAIIGESGCGKSTLLKLIYGLYDLDKGEIVYDNKQILGPKFNLVPGEDYIKYLAQDFDLMPYINVEENIGKFLSNMNKDKKAARVRELLEMVEMTEFAKIKPKYLSGGQQQRVALARVLALEPEVLLLDEPFSQIDTFRKSALRRNLFQYLKAKQIICIIATHDSKDILAFSDETIVIQNGNLIVKDQTQKVYELQKSKYIASLFDEVNEIPSHLLQSSTDKETILLVYPYQLQVVEKSDLKVRIQNSFYKGNGYLIEAVFEKQRLYFESLTALEKEIFIFLALKK
ncbi:ABC transporter ATP-binding protein [Flavobacterium psychrotolerans]|uniref:ABC transporter ATP-binding protein n=1 Tax=Flavobacterium psychrotolerans TaxID=2169410 RepID=A0A2U1JHY6_9FLAO|nr:ATP-binding cassette domain-containing protein [Flavobacterium psychrotolerans]PWA04609.1 ABC transporter ATP-binding protein [Flavobacterium psychrotolerans]